MRLGCFLLLGFIQSMQFILSQEYGNEWIKYDQKYYTFKIVNTGFYKLDYSSLRNSGVDVSSFKSSNIQLISRQKEVPIYIKDGGDNKLDSGDYILFYATKNDGWLDSLLFEKPEDIGNPGVSLINDTITYFFTWNNQVNSNHLVYDTTTTFSNLTPSNYWMLKSFVANTGYYCQANGKNGEVSSIYKPGEGWTFNVDGVKSVQSFDFDLINSNLLYKGVDAPSSSFQFKNTSHSNASFTGKGNHHFKISLKNSNTTLIDTIFSGYQLINTSKKITSSSLINNGIINFSILNDQGALTDFQGLGYIGFEYPQITSLIGGNSGSYWIQNSKIASKIRLSISNHTSKRPFAFLLGNQQKMIVPTNNGSNLEFVVPNNFSSNEQQFIIGDLANLKSVNQVFPVNLTGYFTNYSKISSEEAILMVYPTALQESAVEYASYRTSIEGGLNNVVFASVEELFLQYGGGIPKHFIGIRRFAKQMYDQSIHKPKALFLVGKAISNDVIRYNTSNYYLDLVPTFGSPASDIAYTSNLDGSMVPLIPTGRITVLSNDELKIYLDKVKEYEKQQDSKSVYSTETKDWQKHILHFAGGSNINQQTTFQGYLSGMQAIAESKYFGGKITTIKKQTSAPVDPVVLKDVTKRIEEGVSLMNFFGHSNASTFDVGIDDPSNWNNKGKYPVVLGNGCNSGDVYSTQESFSHKLLIIPNSGGIAFLSPSSLGYDFYMNKYANAFYKQFANLNYGGTIGEHIKFTIKDIYSNPVNNLDESTCFNMSLNGDPTLKINSHNNPEFEITNQAISIYPKEINLSTDTITIWVKVKNLGKTAIDTFQIELKRKFPKFNSDSIYTKRLNGLNYIDSVFFKIPLQSNIGTGLNELSISTDIPSFVHEQYDEVENNQVKTSMIIAIDGITPVYPYNYAIVGFDTVNVKASTNNPISSLKNYRFEIDTSISFNSPAKRYTTKTGLGGVYETKWNEWISTSTNINSPLKGIDSTVYFWRVSIDSFPYQWNTFSYEYIKNKYGWGQSNIGQFANNSFNAIDFDSLTAIRKFDTLYKIFDLVVYDRPSQLYQYQETVIRLNKELQDYGACFTVPSLHVVVIDPKTLTPWRTHYGNQNPQNSFGNFNDVGGCIPRTQAFFVFRQNDSLALQNFDKMINQHVPDGHYLIVYTIGYGEFNNWDKYAPSIYSTFKSLGSDSLTKTRKNNSFIFYCQKGNVKSAKEMIASDYEKLFFQTNLYSYKNSGSESTPFIGPSLNWQSLYWKFSPLELNSSDTTELIIEQFDKSYNKIGELVNTINFKDSILNLKSKLNLSTYSIRLKNNYRDVKDNTPSKLNSWRILYDEIPEAAISPRDQFYWSAESDTLMEGEKIKFSAAIKNVSTKPMDSLLVDFKLIDATGKINLLNSPRLDSLRVNSQLSDTIEFTTKNYPGENTLLMEVNPYVSSNIQDQPEQYYFNNILQRKFYVQKDNTNPILDVTFNGKHIMNNDLISANSSIQISLKDENQFDIMSKDSDTSFFWVYLTDPKGNQKRIPFMNQKGEVVMKWTPATASNRKFFIVYDANFEQNGTYLLQVQGADRNGNLSGKMEYKIQFEVQTENAISYFINYPNPFTTSTKFIYTLTGSNPPSDYKVQIFTISGKLIKEISKEELGVLSVGRNQLTNYSWDGKDEFGDQLANGVYLYKLIINDSSKDVKHIENSTDNFFKNGFGKMYLMR
jgi:hypothetical protein